MTLSLFFRPLQVIHWHLLLPPHYHLIRHLSKVICMNQNFSPVQKESKAVLHEYGNIVSSYISSRIERNIGYTINVNIILLLIIIFLKKFRLCEAQEAHDYPQYKVPLLRLYNIAYD